MKMGRGYAGTALLALSLTLAVSGSHGERELPEVKPEHPLEFAKDFRLADIHGVRMRLSETESQVIILHFWTRYRDCVNDLAIMQRVHESYAGRDVKVIGLVYNSGTREDVAKFLADEGVDFPNLMCTSEVRGLYDVSTFPTTFILDGEKRIRYWMYGHVVEKHWSQLAAELLDEAAGTTAAN